MLRRIGILVIAVVILVVVNFAIYQKEQLLAQGTTLLL